MKKYFFIPLFAMFIFCFPFTSNAHEVKDFWEYFDMTYEDFQFLLIEDGLYCLPNSSSFSLVNPDYIKESTLIDDSISINYSTINSSTINTRSGRVGDLLAYGNTVNHVDITLGDGVNLLFSEPGNLTLNLLIYSELCELHVYRSDGTITSLQLVNGFPFSEYLYLPADLDNTNNDIVKIVIDYDGYIIQSNTGTLLSVGIKDYGYLIVEPEPDPEPDVPVTPNFDGYVTDSLSFIMSSAFAYINSLFMLNIVSNLSLGYFLLAVMILALIFNFFLHKLVK